MQGTEDQSGRLVHVQTRCLGWAPQAQALRPTAADQRRITLSTVTGPARFLKTLCVVRIGSTRDKKTPGSHTGNTRAAFKKRKFRTNPATERWVLPLPFHIRCSCSCGHPCTQTLLGAFCHKHGQKAARSTTDTWWLFPKVSDKDMQPVDQC